jgi:hypothetical protein
MLLCDVQENYAVAGILAENEQGFVGLESLLAAARLTSGKANADIHQGLT